MPKTVGNILLYMLLSFSSPAIGAMRMMDRIDPVVVIFSGTQRKRRYRVLERRYGYSSEFTLVRL